MFRANIYSKMLLNAIKRSRKNFSTNHIDEADKPIKFFGSAAAKRAVVAPIRREITQDMPWYQPISIVGSISVFLIYFCILREENDIDTEFNKTLYDRIKGLEKQQLLISYQYNKENGLSVTEIELRLQELEELEGKALH